MSNSIFPALPGLSWNVVKNPTWSTNIKRSVSGASIRAARFANPIWNFTLTYEVLRAATAYQELQQLVSFFNLRQGSFDSFLYQDPYDHAVSNLTFNVGDGTTTTFQFIRQVYSWVEPVAAVENGALIYNNGSLVNSSNYSINSNAGTITFNTAPANGHSLSWSGNFYYRCCFLKDGVDFENFMKDLWQLKKLEFESVR